MTARGARVVFFTLVLFTAALIVHGVWSDWYATARTEAFAAWLMSRKLLSISEGLTVIIALGAVVIAHRQFVHAARTYLHWTTVEADLQAGVWRAILKNAGTGLAVIRSATYVVRFEESESVEGTYEHILMELSRRGMSVGPDFKLVSFSDGSTLAGGDQVVALEAAVARLASIAAIDIRFTYEGVLGDAFSMNARLLPRGGIENLLPTRLVRLN